MLTEQRTEGCRWKRSRFNCVSTPTCPSSPSCSRGLRLRDSLCVRLEGGGGGGGVKRRETAGEAWGLFKSEFKILKGRASTELI